MNSRSTSEAFRFSAKHAPWNASRSSFSTRIRRPTSLLDIEQIIAWIHVCVSKKHYSRIERAITTNHHPARTTRNAPKAIFRMRPLVLPSAALKKRFCAMPHAWRAGSRGWCGPQPAGRGLGPLTLTAMHTLTARGRGLVYLPCSRRLASERTSPLRGRVSGWCCRSASLAFVQGTGRWLAFSYRPLFVAFPLRWCLLLAQWERS